MSFWNVEKLAIRLKKKEVLEKEKFLYFFIIMVVSTVSIYIPVEYGSNWERMMELLVILFITIVGMIACYKKNQRGDGEAFIERFFSLGFPIGIKLVVIAIPLYILYTFIAFLTTYGAYNHTEDFLITIISIALFEIVYFSLLYKWIGFVSN
jgi:hypothetical protein